MNVLIFVFLAFILFFQGAIVIAFLNFNNYINSLYKDEEIDLFDIGGVFFDD